MKQNFKEWKDEVRTCCTANTSIVIQSAERIATRIPSNLGVCVSVCESER